MLCREWRQISLALLLVNCHDVTGGIFSGEFYAKQYEKSFKLHNRPGEIKRTFRKSKEIAGAGFEDLRGMARARRKTFLADSKPSFLQSISEHYSRGMAVKRTVFIFEQISTNS